ncbi:MAG: hypothetical protein J1E97_06640 [Muribaculaceae bacterium]|nr:hypothetical protein [Muribaculaceae bacterium]
MRKFIYISALYLMLGGCREELVLQDTDFDADQYTESTDVYVGFTTRTTAWNIDDEYARFADNVGEREEKPYIVDHFNDGDILFISQMGTTANPVLENINSSENESGDKYTKESNIANLYIYQYQEPEDAANWNEGFNFIPYVNKKNETTPMNWSKIKGLGSIGNSFSFYALFQANNRTPNFRTMTWLNYAGDNGTKHSAYELGTRYGLFGAYHATSSLYTRMRFRLYPLFNLLHVTLLVPVEEPDPDKPGYSGFGPNVFKNNWLAGNSQNENLPGIWTGVPAWANRQLGASTYGMGNSFNINWRASRSSDNDAPLISPISGSSNTCMYLLKYDMDDPYAEHPVMRLDNVREFYPAYDNKNHQEYDLVRRYEFICYYVAQNALTSSSSNAMLSMRLLTPGSSGELYKLPGSIYDYPASVEGTYIPYFFYGNNKGAGQYTGGDKDLGFNTQGTYQHLTLYVPRRGNETVMVSAKVIPWKETYTEMTIVEREED